MPEHITKFGTNPREDLTAEELHDIAQKALDGETLSDEEIRELGGYALALERRIEKYCDNNDW